MNGIISQMETERTCSTAITGEVIDAIDTAAAVEAWFLGAFVNVNFAYVARKSFSALANEALMNESIH
jgi:hypothetical protein